MARSIATAKALIAGAGLALGLGMAGSAVAQHVYKSVDAEGRVTYSATPPPAAVGERVTEIDIAPGPTDAQRDDAHRRLRAQEAAAQASASAQEAEQKRRAEAVAAAQQQLIKAKAELEQAKIQGDGDWQRIVGGGRVPKASYLDRVAAAQARVTVAEQALEAARQGP